MKRFYFLLIACLISMQIFAQTNDTDKINDEYYGLKWGCSIADLKSKYPNVYSDGTNDDGDELYYLDTNGATRIFFFGNGKLFRGRIAYSDCTDEKAIALLTKLTETYGKFDDSNEGSQDGSEYITLIRNYSYKIKINFHVVSVKNSYGYNISQLVMITYENKDLRASIARDRINKMQNDLEL